MKEKEEKLNKVIEDTKISVEILEAQLQNDNIFFKENIENKSHVNYLLIYDKFPYFHLKNNFYLHF